MTGSDDPALDATATDDRTTPAAAPADMEARHPDGATIGRYTLAGVLGSGGMGVVYRASDPHLGRAVALKVVRPGRGSAESRARLIREAQAMAKLAHPNVIAVYDAGSIGDEVFVAMELVDGPNLARWLDGAPRPRREILAMFEQAGRGLAAAHAVGIVHRDFKPLNVLVGKDGRVRVLDFGLARTIQAPPDDSVDAARSATLPPELTQAGATLGTPRYMAPEQHAGHATDARTDQFAFCVALFHALYGAFPFKGESTPELVAAVIAGTVVVPAAPRVPSWLRRILLRGLAVAPGERFASMEGLLDEVARQSRRARRRRVAMIALPVVAAIAVVAAVQLRGGTTPARLPAVASAPGEQITFGGRAAAPALSHDGHHLAYLFGTPGYLGPVDVVIQDLATGTARTVISARRGGRPRWSPDDAALLVTTDVGPLVVPVDGSAPTQLEGCVDAAWSPDGREIAQHCPFGTMWSFVDVATGRTRTVEVAIPGSRSIDDVDWASTGLLLVKSTDPVGWSLWTMRADGSDLRETFRSAAPIIDPRWSASGDAIYFARTANQLAELVMLVRDASGRASVSDTRTIRGADLTISADETTLVATSGVSETQLVTLVAGNRTVLTHDTEEKSVVRASHTGERIAYVASSTTRSRFHVLGIDGTPVATLPVDGTVGDFAWSPDGRELAYLVERDGARSLWRVEIATGKTAALIDTNLGTELDWSPSGPIVVQQADNANLLVVDPATHTTHPLFPALDGWVFGPRVSPEGSRLLAYLNIEGRAGIWVVRLDGTLVDHVYAGRTATVGWSIDGRTAYIEDLTGEMKVLAVDLATHTTTVALDTQLDTQHLEPVRDGWVALEEVARWDLWASTTRARPIAPSLAVAPETGPQPVLHPSPVNLAFAGATTQGVPGWSITRTPGQRTSAVEHDGRTALEVVSGRADRIAQRIAATPYRGKRVAVRFAMATSAGFAGLQVASLVGKHALTAGDVRAIAPGWQSVETIADIRPDAEAIEIAILTTPGTTWIAGGSFEIVR